MPNALVNLACAGMWLAALPWNVGAALLGKGLEAVAKTTTNEPECGVFQYRRVGPHRFAVSSTMPVRCGDAAGVAKHLTGA